MGFFHRLRRTEQVEYGLYGLWVLGASWKPRRILIAYFKQHYYLFTRALFPIYTRAPPDSGGFLEMLTTISRVSTLLIGVALLLVGHGLHLAVVPLKAQLFGWSDIHIGWLGSLYFVGFILGCFSVPALVTRTGHIRAYACMVALMTASILGLALGDNLLLWILLRVISGVSIAGLYLIIESWLNEQASSQVRGSVLAVYTIVVLIGLAAGNLLLNTAPIDGPALIISSAMLIVIAAIPVCVTSSPEPPQIPRARFSPLLVLKSSRAASIGSFIGGLAVGVIYTLGPVYALQRGLDVMDISVMMAMAIAGGGVTQFPLGRLSDRIDRRLVILLCLALGACVAMTALAGESLSVPLMMMLLGASVMPIYALSLAQASDNTNPGDFIKVGTGLLMMNALGSVVGPLLASQLMHRFGPQYFFVYQFVILFAAAWAVVYMIRSKPPSPEPNRDFELATTAAAQAAFSLDPRADEQDSFSADEQLAQTASSDNQVSARDDAGPAPNESGVTFAGI